MQNLKIIFCRIFADSLHCDFNIIHGHKTIRINECIVRARSPRLYQVLKPYFVYTNKTIHCILDKARLFHQIEDFIRYYYTVYLSYKERV